MTDYSQDDPGYEYLLANLIFADRLMVGTDSQKFDGVRLREIGTVRICCVVISNRRVDFSRSYGCRILHLSDQHLSQPLLDWSVACQVSIERLPIDGCYDLDLEIVRNDLYCVQCRASRWLKVGTDESVPTWNAAMESDE